jgi:hypothetical protein
MDNTWNALHVFYIVAEHFMIVAIVFMLQFTVQGSGQGNCA